MTTETAVTKPSKGARFAGKRRLLTIFILLILSGMFVFWHESPTLIIHNGSTSPLLFSIKVEGKDFSVGTIPANTDFDVKLPFFKGRNAAIYFQAKTQDKIISSLAHTAYLGGLDFYIRPDLSIGMDPTPPGFIAQPEDKDEVIIK